MDAIQFIILPYYLLTLFSQFMLIEPYTLTPSQSIIDGESLISQDGTFKLGFFSPSPSLRNRYLGIWYNTISTQTVVWVANRYAPVFGTSVVFKIGSSGKLVIVANHTVVWSSSKPSTAVETPILEFFKSGNLVLRNLRNSDAESYLWQSFDYPTDNLLPGMKLGWNIKTGINRHLTSWKKFDDPNFNIEIL